MLSFIENQNWLINKCARKHLANIPFMEGWTDVRMDVRPHKDEQGFLWDVKELTFLITIYLTESNSVIISDVRIKCVSIFWFKLLPQKN